MIFLFPYKDHMEPYLHEKLFTPLDLIYKFNLQAIGYSHSSLLGETQHISWPLNVWHRRPYLGTFKHPKIFLGCLKAPK